MHSPIIIQFPEWKNSIEDANVPGYTNTKLWEARNYDKFTEKAAYQIQR